ncbi:MAG: hypothetical protein ABIP17_13330 [Ilumatobacteraceae bacterium]
MSGSRHLALTLALVLGACSNGDSDSLATVAATTPSTIESSTTAPTTASATAPAADTTTVPPTTAPPADSTPTDPTDDEEYVELATTALLDLSVFPDGWESSPATEDDEAENERFADRVDVCLGNEGARVADLIDGRKATSPEFAGPGDSSPSVEQQIMIADDDSMAVMAMDDIGAEGADVCLEQTIQEFFDAEASADVEQQGVTLGDISVQRVDVDAAADVLVAYLVEIPVEAPDGQSASGYLQVIYQREGRALSQLQLSSFGTTFDLQGIDVLTTEVVTRLTQITE